MTEKSSYEERKSNLMIYISAAMEVAGTVLLVLSYFSTTMSTIYLVLGFVLLVIASIIALKLMVEVALYGFMIMPRALEKRKD